MSDDMDQTSAGAEARLRDLTSRLGFGDGITEPQADNDTIVEWFEERGREADEWRESQFWRDDCYLAGHPEDEDCWEHDPTLRLAAAQYDCGRYFHLWNDLRWGLTELTAKGVIDPEVQRTLLRFHLTAAAARCGHPGHGDEDHKCPPEAMIETANAPAQPEATPGAAGEGAGGSR